MTTLALCMIVRDEAEALPQTLAAARGLYDELCVVDTGSQDDTPAILRAAGAKLAHLPWADDFAAARNASLDLAQAPWVMVLDADERISPACVRAARALLGDARAGAATVELVNAQPHGGRRRSSLLRMFRRHPSVRYSYPIHEDVTQAALAHLAREGLLLRHLAGEVEHLGYAPDHPRARAKWARDRRLLEARLAAAPEDLYSAFKLLELARLRGEVADLAPALAAAELALERAPPAALQAPHVGELVALMAFCRPEAEARPWLRGWAHRLPPSAALCLALAELDERAGAGQAAADGFAACLRLQEGAANRQLGSVRPALGLARLALGGGDGPLALGWVQRALALAPRDPEALLALFGLAWHLGGRAQAERMAAAYRSDFGDPPELAAAVQEAARLAGGRQDLHAPSKSRGF